MCGGRGGRRGRGLPREPRAELARAHMPPLIWRNAPVESNIPAGRSLAACQGSDMRIFRDLLRTPNGRSLAFWLLVVAASAGVWLFSQYRLAQYQ